MPDILYKDYTTFVILKEEINLISDDTDYGRNTIAEMNNQFYYLGNKLPNIYTAILVWENIKGKQLSDDELLSTIENHV